MTTTKCDDHALNTLLDATQEHFDSADDLAITRHIETCTRCQDRLSQLAAEDRQWTELQQMLSPDDLSWSAYSESLNARDRCKRPTAWTKAMGRSLLAPPSHPEMLGRIGRYDVERLIGYGGMGVVFKAHDTELNRPVAIKLLAPYLAENGAARQRFAREARAAAAVVDEHVVAIHNVESGDDPLQPPFLVMKFIAGGSLQQRLDREGPLDVCEILRIGMQTAQGLAAAHAQGLIHRDVKPSNILLDEGVERALLTDFGLARAQDDACLTHSGFHPGTPHYMSPEQVRGESIDARSDLFSLGCVLYALCTGHPPFRAESSYAVLHRITNDNARPIRQLNPNIPDWLEAIVMKLLSKSREDRFESSDDVAALLKNCLAHVQHPTTTPLPKSAAQFSPVLQSGGFGGKQWRRLLYIGAGAISLIFAGVLIVLEMNKGTLTIESEVDDVPIRIMQSDHLVKKLTVTKAGESVRIAAGNYVVMIDGQTDGILMKDGRVSLRRGEVDIAKIVRSTDSSDASADLPPHAVNIVLGKSQFADGDSIEIQSVISSGNGLEVGAMVTVKGIYTLESTEAANLSFFSTVTLKRGETPTATPVQPSQTMNATKGTHAFQLSKVITEEGSPHITFYDQKTGQALSGVYFAESDEVKIRGTINFNKSAVNLPSHAVNFALGKAQFADGDNIEIQSVTSSGNGLEAGATVTVKGVYTLESADAADLCFYSTTTLKPGETPTATPVQPSQSMKATKGTHEFQLSKVITEEGSPHITFYHHKTGNALGGVYFSVTQEDTIRQSSTESAATDAAK